MSYRVQVDNSQDILDSRDIIARIEELESDGAGIEDAEALQLWEDENRDELKALQALAEEASGSPDWVHGETLIKDSYFEEYAEQLADDIGAIDRNATWPVSCIDWERAARELQSDYTSVDFDGETYWIRS